MFGSSNKKSKLHLENDNSAGSDEKEEAIQRVLADS